MAIWVIVLLTLVLAIQGIYQYYTGVGLGGITALNEHGTLRIRGPGIFNDPNDLALSMVIIVPILLTYLLGSFSIVHKFISILLGGAFIYAIVLTNSRGGWLALLAVFFFYFQKSLGKLGIAIGIILALLLFVIGPSRMGELSAEESSSQGRLSAWSSGIQMLKAYPIFGVGRGNYTGFHAQTAHNSLMLAAAETGLIGAFFWVALIYMSFKFLSFVQKATQEQDNQIALLARALQVSLAGFLVAAFFLSRTYNILPYILVALSVCIYNISRRENMDAQQEVRFSSRDVINVIFIEIGGLILIYGMVRFL